VKSSIVGYVEQINSVFFNFFDYIILTNPSNVTLWFVDVFQAFVVCVILLFLIYVFFSDIKSINTKIILIQCE